ncbi:hypothetical protein GOV11_03525 [Candidatus Woesearchaeota archaeon]|nr:hypothetical protein [Candidatus Woesearchaeota archaeon]
MDEFDEMKKRCREVSYRLGGHAGWDKDGKWVDDSLLEEIEVGEDKSWCETDKGTYTKEGWKNMCLNALEILKETADELWEVRK